MREDDDRRLVKMAFEVRVAIPDQIGGLAAILELLRRSGVGLWARQLGGEPPERLARFICDDPTEAAVALCDAGFEAGTDTVVTVRIEDEPDAFDHLALTLEAAGLAIESCYAVSSSGELFAVFRTDDNPRAEDVLSNYLHLEDEGSVSSPGSPPPLT